MTWFERITGFPEGRDYVKVQARLSVTADGRLAPGAVAPGFRVGEFSMPSLAQLRVAAGAGATPGGGRSTVRIVGGDVGVLHADPAYLGAVFQVASQFNCLEMPGPGVTPEDGVGGYEHDRTQGPVCAMAAGAATIYRNYLVPVGDNGAPRPAGGPGDEVGQRATRQLDGLADLGAELARRTGLRVLDLWDWRNGYALVTGRGLAAINAYLASLDPGERDALMGLLRIGIHSDVEVTRADAPREQTVTQAFCSAIPVAYSRPAGGDCEPLARLILDAAYEATLLQGVSNARRGAGNVVALTLLGGGVFGNSESWILPAIGRALDRVQYGLDVRIVSYGKPSPALKALVARRQGGG
jgi:hypothetical protein